MGNRPFVVEKDTVRLAVRVTPGAKRNAVGGIVHDANGRPALAIRLTAPPVDGAANKALCDFVAKLTGVRRSSVAIRSGEAGRLKILQLSGDIISIVRRLEGALPS